MPASCHDQRRSAYTFTASATDHDLPAQTLTFSLSGAPAGATIGAASGVFTWTPTEAQGPGVYTFDVVVSDGVTTTSQTIAITVNEVNVAPVLSGVPVERLDQRRSAPTRSRLRPPITICRPRR